MMVYPGDSAQTISSVKVSVIIPFYNRADLIGRAVESVLRQTYKNLDIILVDDASTDEGPSIVEAFRDPKIRLITRERRGGAGAARNSGIRFAEGNVLTFLDSDDQWFPEKISTQMAVLKNPDNFAPGVVCSFTVIEKDSQRNLAPLDNRHRLIRQLEWGCALSPGSTLMVNKETFEEIGYFDESYQRLEDWEWLIRYAEKYELVTTPDILCQVNRMDAQDPVQALESSIKIDRQYREKFRKLGAFHYRRFRSSICVEQSASYYRAGRFTQACFYFLASVFNYPLRNLSFYKHTFLRALELFSGKLRELRG